MNYYEQLNIERDADAAAVKRAYFAAVKVHSPDSDPKTFKAIRLAYETLSDQKKRAEYDSYFVSSGGGAIADDLQSELLQARELMRENKYKQAAEFLTELCGKKPDEAEAKRLLAEVLWYMKKSGTAVTLCTELLEKNPSDSDTMLLRARIAASQGHWTKAEGFFNGAVSIDPLKPKPWIEFMHYAIRDRKWLIATISRRALGHDPDIFRDEYYLYLAGVLDLNFDGLDLFSTEDETVLCLDKFAEFFISDKNPDKVIFPYLMAMMPKITQKSTLIPFVEKVLPALENSRQRTEEDEQSFKYIRAAIVVFKLRADKRIHEVLVDLTELLLYDAEEKNEQQGMECYIAFNLPTLRPSIRVLKNEYPECFKVHQEFFLEALNEKRTEAFTDKHAAILKKIKAVKPELDDFDDFDEGDGYYYDDYEPDEVKTFVRESPKVGRNDPCPCGSGKKYKKCCG